MNNEFTQEEVEAHDVAFQQGFGLIEGQIRLDDGGSHRRPGRRARRKLQQAAECFTRALAINPENWQSMWALGKIHQRMEEPDKALEWFERAYEKNPSEANVAREAGWAALKLGNGELAVRYCETAAQASPGDPGLVANLALAYLMRGDVPKAQQHARHAVSGAPDSEMTNNVLSLVNEVAEGRQSSQSAVQEIRQAL